MARQRMVKPEFFDSESLAECSLGARLLFIGLWVMGDDYGNQKANLNRLRRRVFPYDDMTADEFLSMLAELESVGCIKGYEVDGERYINVPNFLTYQTVRKPSSTNVPEPPEKVKKAGITANIKAWETVEKGCEKPLGTTLVRHQYATSGPERKKERRKEGTLKESLPNEVGGVGPGTAGAAPPPPDYDETHRQAESALATIRGLAGEAAS